MRDIHTVFDITIIKTEYIILNMSIISLYLLLLLYIQYIVKHSPEKNIVSNVHQNLYFDKMLINFIANIQYNEIKINYYLLFNLDLYLIFFIEYNVKINI